jgi:hypothetical protein
MELRSPSDPRETLQAKMTEYLANGAMLDGDPSGTAL